METNGFLSDELRDPSHPTRTPTGPKNSLSLDDAVPNLHPSITWPANTATYKKYGIHAGNIANAMASLRKYRFFRRGDQVIGASSRLIRHCQSFSQTASARSPQQDPRPVVAEWRRLPETEEASTISPHSSYEITEGSERGSASA